MKKRGYFENKSFLYVKLIIGRFRFQLKISSKDTLSKFWTRRLLNEDLINRANEMLVGCNIPAGNLVT